MSKPSLSRLHTLPFIVFMALLLVLEILTAVGWTHKHQFAAWYYQQPAYFIYPLQTIICAIILGYYWPYYNFQWRKGWIVGITLGLLGITIWLLPNILYLTINSKNLAEFWQYFGISDRSKGMDFHYWQGTSWFCHIGLRLIRAIIIVSFVEEIFWRGFLMRWLLADTRPIEQVKFGAGNLKSYLVTTILFTLVHQPSDYLAAFIYGSLAYFVAVKTRSLGACVIMHATANTVLCIYILITKQYGLW